jgi:WD40 repeat protein
VSGLAGKLVAELIAHNQVHDGPARIRLRLAVHAGEVHFDEHGVAGAAINFAFRLLDAEPLKRALAGSTGVLAVIASSWFYEEVIRHHEASRPATYRRVRISVKETQDYAWICLPDDPYPPQQDGVLPPSPDVAAPHQLPAAAAGFAGRVPELRALTAPAPASDVPEWVIDRPAEVDDVVRKVCRHAGGPVGITTALRGAGGFGKTTLAGMVCAHPRVRHRFGGRIYQVTVGRDVRDPAAIAGKVNDAAELISGTRPGLTDPAAAGQRLGQILDSGPRMLLVLDDVWEDDQLAPFLIGGRRCIRLVTTRVVQILPTTTATVLVDRMSNQQARAVLMWRLPRLPERTVRGLLAVTGGWPLLLRLVNRILHDAHQVGHALNDRALELIERLTAGGPTAVDSLLPGSPAQLNVDVPAERARAARATIEASALRLSGDDRARLLELGVFAEDEAIPIALVERLWAVTGSLDAAAAARLCHDLDRLALATISRPADGPAVLTLHDVIRSHLRAEVGERRLRAINAALLDALAAELPTAPSLIDAQSTVPVWWRLPAEERYGWNNYLWNNLAYHMAQADRPGEFDAWVADLRWVAARLVRWGPAAPIADLSHSTTPRATALRSRLIQRAHLLTSTEPPHAVVDVMVNLLRNDPRWRAEASRMQAAATHLRLIDRVPAADRSSPVLRRTLTGHTAPVEAVAIAPDGTWLVTGGGISNLVRLWRTDTESAPVRYLDVSGVLAVAIAPDGTWLATGVLDGAVQLWDVATGDALATLTGHTKPVNALAISPDGSWIASGSSDETVRLWDARSAEPKATLTAGIRTVETVAISPDGAWVAAGGFDGTVLWDTATGELQRLDTGWVHALAVAPDGRWLATADEGYRFTIRLWDVASGTVMRTIKGEGSTVETVAIAPDGTWLASGEKYHGAVRIWDTATGTLRATLTGHTSTVHAIAIAPDGLWLVTGSNDRTARLWNLDTHPTPTTYLPDTGGVAALAIGPDGTWLATGGDGVRLWNAVTGAAKEPHPAHTGPVHAVAIAPDGTWLATGGDDATVRLWPATGVVTGAKATLTGHGGPVHAIAIAPDGTWIAIGGEDTKLRLVRTIKGTGLAAAIPTAGPVHAAAISPDGQWLVTVGKDGKVGCWDSDTGVSPGTPTIQHGTAHAVAIAPDGTWLAFGCDDGIHVWNDTPSSLPNRVDRDLSVCAVAISPDGTWLATGHSNGLVRLWDIATGRPRMDLSGHQLDVLALAVAPDGTWLATGGDDGTVRLWDVITGAVRTELTGHSGAVHAVAIAPDGSWLATGGAYGYRDGMTARVWDSATGTTRVTLPPAWVTAVVIAPDGAWLATGEENGTIRLWDPNGQPLGTLIGHTRGVNAIDASPDGAWLASTGDDGSLRVWDIDTRQCATLIQVDTPLHGCVWTPSGDAIAVANGAGINLFDLHRTITT